MNPELKNESFATQFSFLEMDGFGASDFWKVNLERIGGYVPYFILVNAEHLQKKWAEEHGFQYNESTWAVEIATEQILRFQPDILFANDYNLFNPNVIARLRKLAPSIRFVIGWDGIDKKDLTLYQGYDLVMSCNVGTAAYYNSQGKNSFCMHFGFEPSLLERIRIMEEKISISSLGSLNLWKGGHHYRLKVLGEVLRRLGLSVWLADFDKPVAYFIKNLLRMAKDGRWRDLSDALLLSIHNREPVYAMDMYNVLASSRFTINTHIDVANNFAGNIRLFEATGVGTCLVTDMKDNLSELFRLDEEVVVYKSPAECVDKISDLMRNEPLRRKIAEAGQRRTLTDYSWEKRIGNFIREFERMV